MLILIPLAVFGSVFGSFAMAQVWRLRARQLASDREKGVEYDKQEYKKLKGIIHPARDDRSKCLNCGYQLHWYDLIPIISWVSLSGRCRHCHQKIGHYEILTELLLAASFALSYALWPYELNSPIAIIRFALWLVLIVLLAILFIYDLKWSLLPTSILTITIICAILYTPLDWQGLLGAAHLFNLLGALVALPIIYLILYLVSRGRWVGSGDYLLALPMALILGHWMLALMTLFISNLLGCIVVLPSLLAGKRNTNSSIPLGPLLIVGFLIAFFAKDIILNILLP